MKAEELHRLLTRLGRRLETIADQARETREQAQHTLDRVERLAAEVEHIRQAITATAETSDCIPVAADPTPNVRRRA
jgi:hypothetical protein